MSRTKARRNSARDDNKAAGDGKVGYGNPPKAHQFKPDRAATQRDGRKTPRTKPLFCATSCMSALRSNKLGASAKSQRSTPCY